MKTLLISAYGCEPLKGSEAGVGWNWVLQMAKHNRLHVITRANNQEWVEEYLPAEAEKNITFYYYDTPAFIKNMKNKAKGLYFYYFWWQLGIMPLVIKINRENKIDYNMHLTFGSMWMPTFLPFHSTPFIWGPVGGGDCEPKSFIKTLNLKQRIMQRGRYVMNALSFLHPSIIIPALKAKKIICRTEGSAKVIPAFLRHKTSIMLETAMEGDIFNYQRKDHNDSQLRFISTGRLMASKNILTAIRALAMIPQDVDYKYTIVGSGPQKKLIENEAKKLGIYNKIEMIAEMPRSEVLKKLEESDVYLFPSLREGGSWALMEAMVIGLPVICLDWAGMKIIVDNKCAFLLPVTSPEQMPIDMAEAIKKIIGDRSLIQTMGAAGRKRIKTEYNWDTKGEYMESVLKELDR
jgi:glycosyltransferase involved in cell wall biosynthesis